MFEKMKKRPVEVVDITSPTMNSILGRYFIGQTGILNFGNRYNAWGGIINPDNSGVNLYFDIWLNVRTPSKAIVSSTVTPSNQSISPPPKPKTVMKYADHLSEPLTKGVNIFGRIVTSNSTLVSDSHKGSIIIGPGGSFSILLKSPRSENITGTIVLTWWEEKI